MSAGAIVKKRLSAYVEATTSPVTAAALALPLLVIYGLGTILIPEARNGVDLVSSLLAWTFRVLGAGTAAPVAATAVRSSCAYPTGASCRWSVRRHRACSSSPPAYSGPTPAATARWGEGVAANRRPRPCRATFRLWEGQMMCCEARCQRQTASGSDPR